MPRVRLRLLVPSPGFRPTVDGSHKLNRAVDRPTPRDGRCEKLGRPATQGRPSLRVERANVDYGAGSFGTLVPYFALIASINTLAIAMCAFWAGWTPSSETYSPNGARGLVKAGTVGTSLAARSWASTGFRSTYT